MKILPTDLQILNTICNQYYDKDRTIYRRDKGKWANKRNDAGKSPSVHNTQQDAVDSAKIMLKNQGSGEFTIIGRNRKMRSKDTINPGNDPCPPKDEEH